MSAESSYVDHYFDPVFDMAAFAVHDLRPSTGRRTATSPNLERFPKILYMLLANTTDTELDSIIGWQPHGRSFIVRDKTSFALHILPR